MLHIEDRLIPWLMSLHFLGIDSWLEGVSFLNHFLLQAVLTFLLLTIPWRHRGKLALLSLAFAFWFELMIDGHYKDIFTNTPGGMEGRTDLLPRVLGATLPLVTLLWRKRI